jgi:hypothetical protein
MKVTYNQIIVKVWPFFVQQKLARPDDRQQWVRMPTPSSGRCARRVILLHVDGLQNLNCLLHANSKINYKLHHMGTPQGGTQAEYNKWTASTQL